MPIYFDKPLGLMPQDSSKYKSDYLHRARQMYDLIGNQNPSMAFTIYWLQLMTESYQKAIRVHPRSPTKRLKYLHNVYPQGVSIYRSPTKFLRWYLEKNGGQLMGDPTGGYYIPINTADTFLEVIPHPFPDTLADRFTLSILKYLTDIPKIRYVRQGYGYVELNYPTFTYLDSKGRARKHNREHSTHTKRNTSRMRYYRVKLTGFLSEWEIREFLLAEMRCYLKYHRETMHDTYYRFLQNHPLITGNI